MGTLPAMAIVKCRAWKKAVSRSAKSCPQCEHPAKSSARGCLMLVVLGCGLAFHFAMVFAEPTYMTRSYGLDQPAIESTKVAGPLVSTVDCGWRVQIAAAPSSGGAYGGWNGSIRLYGPHPNFDRRPFRCRTFGVPIAVEVINAGETTIGKMFTIVDAHTLTCNLPEHWPGILQRM